MTMATGYVTLGSTNGSVFTRTIFPHKEIHKLIWRSPDGREVNQIDNV